MTDETRKNGGPAFPRQAVLNGSNRWHGPQEGMSLRDWFAGQALVGLLSGNPSTRINQNDLFNVLSAGAYGIADAMLAQRENSND